MSDDVDRPELEPEPDVDEGEGEGDARFDPKMLEALICPQTRAVLSWDPVRRELISKAAGLAYPVRDGIPVMLVDEARQLD